MTRSHARKKAAVARKNLKPPVGKAHLLVVDDEVDFARMIQRTLTQAGYRVDAAVSAAQAITLQRKHSYDLALVDMRMPEMTGLELLQYLKVRDRKMFVILMTAYGSLSLGIEALRKGAIHYLAKPFKLTDLKRDVADALTRRAHYLEEQGLFTQRATLDEW